MVGNLINSEDNLKMGMFLCTAELNCMCQSVIPHLLQGGLIIEYVPYIGTIDVMISQIPTYPTIACTVGSGA